MSAAKHTPAGDASFRSSLLRSAVGAVGLVVLVSAAFWAIGTLGGDRGTPVATDGGPEVTAPADDPDADEVEDGDAGDADGDVPEVDGDEPDDGQPDTGEDDAGGEARDGDGDADDADADGDGDGASEVDRSVAPGEVTVQVLDGFKEDGGTAADRVAEFLADAGYDVVARNDALSYEVTTVLYNPGNEAAAQQVAAELGGAEVREQPGNLSTAVALHVVVGRDRG